MGDIKEVESIEEVKNHIDSKGTLSTAKVALEQGKPVFVGNVEDGDLNIQDIIKKVKEQS